MTKDEMRIAIAESLPDLFVIIDRDSGVIMRRPCAACEPPVDPLEDLNVMHEVEKTLNQVEQGQYSTLLSQRDDKLFIWDFDTIHKSAFQRAKAYLRTIGKWKD